MVVLGGRRGGTQTQIVIVVLSKYMLQTFRSVCPSFAVESSEMWRHKATETVRVREGKGGKALVEADLMVEVMHVHWRAVKVYKLCQYFCPVNRCRPLQARTSNSFHFPLSSLTCLTISRSLSAARVPEPAIPMSRNQINATSNAPMPCILATAFATKSALDPWFSWSSSWNELDSSPPGHDIDW